MNSTETFAEQTHQTYNLFVESGQKRVFVGGIDWPGWCRSGRDEASAIQALLENAPAYQKILQNQGISFELPASAASFTIQERVTGNATTDFGAPGGILQADQRSMDEAETTRQRNILLACWQALDANAEQAVNRILRKGPRGGGRELDDILKHILEADQEYLARVAPRVKNLSAMQPIDAIFSLRATMLAVLPNPSPTAKWPIRYFIRRVAWHALDHAWEIANRME